jgi:uncharacterized membrane protein
MEEPSYQESFFQSLHPLSRMAISLVVTGLVYLFLLQGKLSLIMKILILWDVFAFCFLLTAWFVILNRTTNQIRHHARQEDGSNLFVYIIVILSSFASIVTVLLLLLSKDAASTDSGYVPVAVAGMLLSWTLVHTTYTIHYAHIYYGDDTENKTLRAEGLLFPGEKNPDYLDFAYFSFVIGMTFQVSDVNITARRIRRTALLHGLLSFVLNTFVVALTINLIAGLKQ